MKNANQIINDSVKATLFGKFYEKILSCWLKEKKFTIFGGKPRVYWKDLEFNQKGSELACKLTEVLSKYKSNKQYCTPDGFLQRDGSYYIWEAKNWPHWSEGKKPLVQLRDVLCSTPLILSTKAVYRGKRYNLDGVIFFWWSKPEGADTLSEEINRLISPGSFEIFYTADVLTDCIAQKYSWYAEIIKEEKMRIDEFFRDLAPEQVREAYEHASQG